MEISGEIDGAAGEGGSKVIVLENLGSLTVGGAVRGSDTLASGSIQVSGSLGSVRIGSLLGGMGEQSGSVLVSRNIGNVDIGDDFTAGSSFSAGSIRSTNGRIGQIHVGGDMDGSASSNEPMVEAETGVAGLSVGGDLIKTEIHAGVSILSLIHI